MVGMRFNTIGVSDGISMGTEGMSFSLQSRDHRRFDRDRHLRAMVRRQYSIPAATRTCRAASWQWPDSPSVADGLRWNDRADAWETKSSISSRPSRYGEYTPAKSRMKSGKRSPAGRSGPPAAVCTRPTRWLRPSKPWGCRPHSSSIPADDRST